MTAYETLLIEKDARDAFATITLNRPDKLNAMSKTLIRELDRGIAEAVADPGVNALILTGAGRAFSTGYDIGGGSFDADLEFWRDDVAENCEKLLNVWRAPIPIIAAVHGYALAGGLELMMCCDLVIAADDARFGEPEIRHNSAPPALMMPWLLSTRDARWLMFTGDTVDAREALSMRLVNRLAPSAEVMNEARRLARKLARMPTPAIKFAKAALNHQQITAGLLSSFQYNIEAVAALHSTTNGKEWMKKFGEMPLKEFLAFRDAPYKNLD
jgi:enoyl-CoA hydratase/carnithine racemase